MTGEMIENTAFYTRNFWLFGWERWERGRTGANWANGASRQGRCVGRPLTQLCASSCLSFRAPLEGVCRVIRPVHLI